MAELETKVNRGLKVSSGSNLIMVNICLLWNSIYDHFTFQNSLRIKLFYKMYILIYVQLTIPKVFPHSLSFHFCRFFNIKWKQIFLGFFVKHSTCVCLN